MFQRSHIWRQYTRDRIFLLLAITSILTIALALSQRRPALEPSTIPFSLSLFFTVVNAVFAFLTLRREPLLAYMFLTVIILVNGTLFFFYRYLLSIQGG